MSDQFTAEEVAELEAGLVAVKQDFAANEISEEEYDNAKRALVEARRDWRIQEEQAGNRTGFVGGEATKEE